MLRSLQDLQFGTKHGYLSRLTPNYPNWGQGQDCTYCWKVWAWEAEDDLEAADREGLQRVDPHDRDNWRSGVRSAMCAASQLPGRRPTVMDIAPVPVR